MRSLHERVNRVGATMHTDIGTLGPRHIGIDVQVPRIMTWNIKDVNIDQ